VAKDGGWVAFRVVDNRLAIVSVKIGGTSGDRIEILEGLSPGDQVVLKNDPSFAPGTKVKPK
jgi:multidrug efflux pump subunit AcrA (membrane-fusion protein)